MAFYAQFVAKSRTKVSGKYSTHKAENEQYERNSGEKDAFIKCKFEDIDCLQKSIHTHCTPLAQRQNYSSHTQKREKGEKYVYKV